MRKTLLVLGCCLLGAVPLRAQDEETDATGRAGQLRRAIEDRFAARVQEELGLTDQQASRMRQVVGGYFVKRRTLEAEGRRLRQSLASELRPGVAANKDNVSRLTGQVLDLKVRYAQTYKDEVTDLSAFLDPVQIAQFLILRERLLDRIQQAMEDRDQMDVPPRRRLRP
jgi:hypothetical protein